MQDFTMVTPGASFASKYKLILSSLQPARKPSPQEAAARAVRVSSGSVLARLQRPSFRPVQSTGASFAWKRAHTHTSCWRIFKHELEKAFCSGQYWNRLTLKSFWNQRGNLYLNLVLCFNLLFYYFVILNRDKRKPVLFWLELLKY